jgi:putative oxidoreductase
MVEKLSALHLQAGRSVRSVKSLTAGLTHRQIIFMLRLSLAIVFVWFGALKLIDSSPAVQLIRQSFPLFASSPYLELLGLAEMLIGAGLIFDRLSKYAALLLVLHLIGTLCVVLVSPATIFAPAFPVLTMEGEFILKNVVLIVAGLAVASSQT